MIGKSIGDFLSHYLYRKLIKSFKKERDEEGNEER